MPKIDRILHPTDFSDCSREAFPWAVYLARELDAELQMLHVVTPRGENVPDPTSRFPTPDELFEEIARTARTELSELAKAHGAELLRVREVINIGVQAGPTILDHAREESVDLIVMGTLGRRAAAQFLMGSVAQVVVRDAPCPVLCLNASEAPDAPPAVRRILAPVDLSDEDPEALRLAIALATRFDAELWLLHVVDERAWRGVIGGGPVDPVISQMEDLEVTASARLQQRIESMGYEGPVSVRSLVGKPAEAILELVESHGIDLVVMKTRARTGLDRVLLGSTAERILRLASCPIVTLAPGARLATES